MTKTGNQAVFLSIGVQGFRFRASKVLISGSRGGLPFRFSAEDFREMTPNREHNFCCGGGGGLNGIGRYREQRNIGMKIKRDQVLATGAKLVIAPCHNCWDAIRDMEEIYEIGIRWSFLKPLLIHMIEVPEHRKPTEEPEA